MRVRPFRLCSESARSQLETHAAAVFQRWAQDHLGTTAAASLDVDVSAGSTAAEGIRERPATTWWRAQGPQGDVWIDDDQVSSMDALLFGGAARPDGIGAELARGAFKRLAQALSGALEVRAADRPADLLAPGRAVAVVTLVCGSFGLRFWVEPPEATRGKRITASPSVTPLLRALENQTLTVNASLGSVEVDLETICSLRRGDILRLDKQITAGADLAVGTETLPCDAYLVASQGSMAVELAPRPA